MVVCKHLIVYLFLILLKITKICADYSTEYEENDSDLKVKSKIQFLCEKRHDICKTNRTDIDVCGLRILNNIKSYRNFSNSCDIFMSNMCENPGKEYYIASRGNCEHYLAERRNEKSATETTEKPGSDEKGSTETTEKPASDEKSTTETTEKPASDEKSTTETTEKPASDEKSTTETTEKPASDEKSSTETTEKPASDEKITTETTEKPASHEQDNSNNTDTESPLLRQDMKTTSEMPWYPVVEAYDGHLCPHSCKDVYEPICVNVNRDYGLYFKIFTFTSHCQADLYYCKYPDEFSPPPGEEDDPYHPLVRLSPMSWSFCGANRYLSFARFTEIVTTMGRFGWLAGNYRQTHIMEPNERIPGYG